MEAAVDKMVYPTYERYKDSGVEWLGEIPEEWELTRLGTRFEERRTKVSDKEFPPLSVTKQGILPQLDSAAKSNDGDNRKLVKKGDFVINSRSDRKGSSGISNADGSVSLINIVLHPKGIHPIYCNYLLKSHGFVEEFYRMGHGIVADLWTTRYDEMKAIMVSIPTLDEQSAIAAFLDRKTAQIDQAIERKERQIELLKERRQILIHKSVTRGLDPNVPMKDSGVEWIGEIPSHWEVKRLKLVANLISEKVSSKNCFERYIGMENIESGSGNLIEIESEVEGLASKFKVGDVLFGKLRSYLAKAFLSDFNGICSTELLVYRTNGQMSNGFFLKVLLSNGFIRIIDGSTYGSKMPRANADFIGSQMIPVPPLEEQRRINDSIEALSTQVKKIIQWKDVEIAKLKEFKASLVNEAVTGKIKLG